MENNDPFYHGKPLGCGINIMCTLFNEKSNTTLLNFSARIKALKYELLTAPAVNLRI